MAWTQDDIGALKASMRHGALSVRYPDGRQVTYRSLDEMRELLGLMQKDVRAAAGGGRRKRQIRITTSSGF